MPFKSSSSPIWVPFESYLSPLQVPFNTRSSTVRIPFESLLSPIGAIQKFQSFYAGQILRQINFRHSRSSKLAFFAILRDVNLVNVVNCNLPNMQNQTSKPRNVLKRQILSLRSPTMISRRIWVTEKSWNFHTVHLIVIFYVKSILVNFLDHKLLSWTF